MEKPEKPEKPKEKRELPIDQEAKDLLNALQFLLCIRHASDIRKCTKYKKIREESQKES